MNRQKEKEKTNPKIIDFFQKSRMEKRMFPNFDWMKNPS